MRRFAFSLERVLELRRHVEREWELKLAEVTSRVVGVQQEMHRLDAQRIEMRNTRVFAGRVDMEALHSREEYVVAITRRHTELEARLVTLEQEREKVRAGYIEASSARKALDKLRERQSSVYYKEAQKEEDRAIDDISNSQQVVKMREREESDV
ncbi:MAG: flagellar export protein FliJ [Spirochaetales bacterium]